ncbi:MAG: hypothetical protein GEU93_15065 [Propionibacteriales bacterium]|nr:hypothetical protein [Propionibacteriales bacterium]
MRTMKPLRFAAIGAAFALVVAACGGGDEGDGGDDGADGGASGGSYITHVSEPEQLAPSPMCYESECGAIWSMIGEPMVSVDFESGELVFDGLLESIETEDNTVFTLTIKDGWTFHNGDPVDADALIRGWTWTQNEQNAADTAGFLGKLEGAGEANPSGLEKIDDLTVEVALSGAFVEFPKMLSFRPAFQPQAEECLQDTEACNEQPIGIGPYMMDGPWQHNQAINLVRYEDYAGEAPAEADSIQFKIEESLVNAFRDFSAGNIDLLRTTDPTVYPQAEGQYADQMIQEDQTRFTYMSFPMFEDYYKNPDLRRGISLAIDRQAIIDNVLNGIYEPSTDIVPPAMPGSRDDACEYCTFDPEQAKQLFEQGGGSEGDELTLFFNADAGHEGWVEAVGRQLAQNLGITFKLRPLPWDQYTNFIEEQKFTGPFRLGWSIDYPSPENFIRPLVDSNGDSNYGGYSNEELDGFLSQGDQQDSTDGAYEFYHQAGDVALDEMPLIPLWTGLSTIIPGDNVSNVRYDPATDDPAFGEVTVN